MPPWRTLSAPPWPQRAVPGCVSASVLPFGSDAWGHGHSDQPGARYVTVGIVASQRVCEKKRQIPREHLGISRRPARAADGASQDYNEQYDRLSAYTANADIYGHFARSARRPSAAASDRAARSRSDISVTGSGHGMASSGSSNAIDTSWAGSCGRSMR